MIVTVSGTPGTGKTEIGWFTLERTGAHEFGHSAYLYHPQPGKDDGNIMHRTFNVKAGMKLTYSQIRWIEYRYKAGKLNQD